MNITAEKIKDLWQPVEIQRGCTFHWQVGPLRIWAGHMNEELVICYEDLPSEPDDIDCSEGIPLPEEIKWHRWAFGKAENKFKLLPLMPDRPVVVRPEAAISFPKGTEGVLYARVPVWIAIAVLDGKEEMKIIEIPTMPLSNTWFGQDTTRGELCYGMKTSARRSIQGAEPAPHRAVCPVKIKNNSQDFFNLERICLRTEHLNIYSAPNQLWASRSDITFKGGGKHDQLSYADDWIENEEGTELLTQRRQPVQGRLLKRSLTGLLSLAG